MIDEEKLRELRGDELRKMNQNGMLPLIYAHLFSLSQMRDMFGRQMQQGKAPAQVPQPAPARPSNGDCIRPPSRTGGRAALAELDRKLSISDAASSKPGPGALQLASR